MAIFTYIYGLLPMILAFVAVGLVFQYLAKVLDTASAPSDANEMNDIQDDIKPSAADVDTDPAFDWMGGNAFYGFRDDD